MKRSYSFPYPENADLSSAFNFFLWLGSQIYKTTHEEVYITTCGENQGDIRISLAFSTEDILFQADNGCVLVWIP